MKPSKNLLAQIEDQMGEFSKGQKAIARYILTHYDKAAFMTAYKLGSTVGVSESTVVRFASEVGYEGYPQLQKALQELIRNRLTSIQRMEVTSEQLGDDVLTKVLNMDIERIRKTLENVSQEDFNRAVDALVNAKHIYIIGIRSAASLAGFLSFYFNHIFDNSRLVQTSSTSEIFEQLLRVGPGDVLVAISFPRYSRRTVNAAKFSKDRGAQVISITDCEDSPLAQYADILMMARSDMASFVDSLVAPMSLINALIVAIGLKKSDEVSKTYSSLEHIWEEYNVYEKADADEEKEPNCAND